MLEPSVSLWSLAAGFHTDANGAAYVIFHEAHVR